MRRPVLPIMLLSVLCLLLSRPVFAEEIKRYSVIIANISRNHVIVQPVVISHSDEFDLFSQGSSIIPPLAALAEKGDAGPLLAYAATLPSVYEAAASPRSLVPGTFLVIEINAKSKFPLISVAGILATMKNVFFAIQGIGIPESGERIIEAGIPYAEGNGDAEGRSFSPDLREGGRGIGTAGPKKIIFRGSNASAGSMRSKAVTAVYAANADPVVRVTIRPVE